MRLNIPGEKVVEEAPAETTKWWDYAVLRGNGIPEELDGLWIDVREVKSHRLVSTDPMISAEFVASNQWEQNGDGKVAVVYWWYGNVKAGD